MELTTAEIVTEEQYLHAVDVIKRYFGDSTKRQPLHLMVRKGSIIKRTGYGKKHLTNGKEYEVIAYTKHKHFDFHRVYIKNDNGNRLWLCSLKGWEVIKH